LECDCPPKETLSVARESVRKTMAITLEKAGTAVEPSATPYSNLRKNLLMETARYLHTYSNSEPYWREYIDVGKRIELLLPSHWENRPSDDMPVNLRASDDFATSVQLSFFALDKLLASERASELIDFDANRWMLQRKAAVIHNGTGAFEADFHIKSNDTTLIMRKVYLPVNGDIAVLGLVTRLATWSRYGSVFRGVQRSFSQHSGVQPHISAHLNVPRERSAPQVVERFVVL
jgi:hypothetical protein